MLYLLFIFFSYEKSSNDYKADGDEVKDEKTCSGVHDAENDPGHNGSKSERNGHNLEAFDGKGDLSAMLLVDYSVHLLVCACFFFFFFLSSTFFFYK